MGRPTADELDMAIAEAIRMRESGNDPRFVAKSLLNLNYRMQYMDRLLSAAKRYLHAGQSMQEHRHLTLAIQAAEKAEGAPDEEKAIPTLHQR